MGLNRFYLYQGHVVVPTVAQSEEGFYMDVEPIQVCDSNHKDKLHGLLVEALQTDNPVVPTPDVHEKGSSAVLERLGLKKWMHFEKLATMYTVYKNDQNVFVYRTARGPDELWTKDDTGNRTFPTGDAESVSGYIMADMAALEALKPAPLGLPGPVSRGILLAAPKETRNS